jgi:hypothetical protein
MLGNEALSHKFFWRQLNAVNGKVQRQHIKLKIGQGRSRPGPIIVNGNSTSTEIEKGRSDVERF